VAILESRLPMFMSSVQKKIGGGYAKCCDYAYNPCHERVRFH
jgi:hypothetical protein